MKNQHVSRTKKNKVYKFVHNQEVWIKTNIKGKEYNTDWKQNNWLSIDNEGLIKIKATPDNGYAWDGCSLKWYFLQLIWGTPDGRVDPRTDKPLTYYASMIHDILYQFRREIDISRKEADLIFFNILREAGFIWRSIYYVGVRLGGFFYKGWRSTETTRNLTISEHSWLQSRKQIIYMNNYGLFTRVILGKMV